MDIWKIVFLTLLVSVSACTAGVVRENGLLITSGTMTAMTCDNTYFTELTKGTWKFDPYSEPPHPPGPQIEEGSVSFFLEYNDTVYGRTEPNHKYNDCSKLGGNMRCKWYDWELTTDLEEGMEWDPSGCPENSVNGSTEIDECPDDISKTDPGECGCGTSDTDTDGDGLHDCYDGFPGTESYANTYPIDMQLFMRGVAVDAKEHWHKNGVSQCFSQPAGSTWKEKAESSWGCKNVKPNTWFNSIFFKNYMRENPNTLALENIFLKKSDTKTFEISSFDDYSIYELVESWSSKARHFGGGAALFTWTDRFVVDEYNVPEDFSIYTYDPCDSEPVTSSPQDSSRTVGPYNLSTAGGREKAEKYLNSSAEQKTLRIPIQWYSSMPKSLGYSGDVWMAIRESFWSPFETAKYGDGTDPNKHYRYEENYDYLCVGKAADACQSIGLVGWRVKYHSTADESLRLLKSSLINEIEFESTVLTMSKDSCYQDF